MEPLLSILDVANFLKISTKTLEKMISRGEAPLMLRIGRQRRWKKTDVEEWLAKQTASLEDVK